MARFWDKIDKDYVMYIIFLFIISFLCYKVYTLNEKAKYHYIQICEHENIEDFNVIFYDQTIASLKQTNKELYDSIKAYKDEIEYLAQFKYQKEYIYDTVFIEKENINRENEQVFEYKNELNDTLNYTLKIGSLYEPNWYKLNLMVSDEFTIINKRYDDKNVTSIGSIGNGEISDVTVIHRKENKSFLDNFYFGPAVNFGYDIINNNFGLNVGFSVIYKIDLNKK